MMQDTINESLDLRTLIIETSKNMHEFLENSYEQIKNDSISAELNEFWNNFEKKLKNVQKNKSDNQIINVYIKLSDSRPILISKMSIIEPWFVKIQGVNCKTGLPELEILNSRNQKPEIIIELYEKQTSQ